MKYIAIAGFHYEDKRFEPGDEVTGLLKKEIRLLMSQGIVKAIEEEGE